MPKNPSTRAPWCVTKIKSPTVRHMAESLIDQLNTLGYTNFTGSHWNGRYGLLQLSIEHDACMKCNKDTKFMYHANTGDLEKTCGSYNCPTHMYTVHMTGDQCMLTEVGWVNERKVHNKTVPGNVRNTDEYERNKMVEAAVEGGWKLAETLFKCQHNHVVTDVFDGKMWWFYDEKTFVWRIDKSGMHIHDTLVKTVRRDYGYLHNRLNEHTTSANHTVMEAVAKLMHNINKTGFRQHLVVDCRASFLDRDFTTKVDLQPNLVVCTNGVYDIDKGELRPGHPSDYLTLSTHRKFVVSSTEYDLSHCAQFIKDVLVDDEVIDMLISAACMSLHGDTQLHKFFLWVGCGSNGKSKLASLFRMALGDLSVTIPVTVFTQKRIEYGKACPELQRTKGRRLVFISEPSHNETLNLGIVKEVTGGDAMFTRGLYEEGGEIQYVFFTTHM